MAPSLVVDYVVAHKLCHLIHHNHSSAYWNLVATLMPDYRTAKKTETQRACLGYLIALLLTPHFSPWRPSVGLLELLTADLSIAVFIHTVE